MSRGRCSEVELPDTDCPYVGLDAFRPEQYALFFGRQRLIEEFIGKLQTNRLLAVVGPSGSGKSTLMATVSNHRTIVYSA